ncbi:hypothetical protein [Pseudomonas viridiflava]|uniref:hypothetical protein n=1 Tax=Pseudomonas viridiflava TaxID=33069 RepID=UPI000F05A699|nr:hypothetical protein [Pseudomonas viridiflava]MEE4149184.1 hypothetical protein [Pseudomonas viridiflava]
MSILTETVVPGFGFLSFGAAAALCSGIMISKIRTSVGTGSFATALLPIILSGTAVCMLPTLKNATSLGFYPIGLLLGLMWQQAGPLLAQADGMSGNPRYLVYAYGGVTTFMSLAAITGVFLS